MTIIFATIFLVVPRLSSAQPTDGTTPSDETTPTDDTGPGATSAVGSEKVNLSESLKHGNVANAWGYVLDFVNIAAIFLLLAIAFANILHINIEEFHIKRMLPALIIGLILANLSHLICRAIIDFAVLVQAYFLAPAYIEGKGIGMQLWEGAFGGWGYFVGAGGVGISLLAFFVPVVGPALGCGLLALTLILVFFPALAMLALAFLLYIRVFILWFLVIASPLAFFGSFLPPAKGLVSAWWKNFLMWTFMGPIAYFIIWVALGFVEKLPAEQVSPTGDITNPSGITRYLFVMAMLCLAIFVPIAMGGKIMGAWGAAGKWLGMRGGMIAGGAGATGTQAAGKGLKKLGGVEVRGKKLGEMRGIGALTRGAGAIGSRMEKAINPADIYRIGSEALEERREANIKKTKRDIKGDVRRFIPSVNRNEANDYIRDNAKDRSYTDSSASLMARAAKGALRNDERDMGAGLNWGSIRSKDVRVGQDQMDDAGHGLEKLMGADWERDAQNAPNNLEKLRGQILENVKKNIDTSTGQLDTKTRGILSEGGMKEGEITELEEMAKKHTP